MAKRDNSKTIFIVAQVFGICLTVCGLAVIFLASRQDFNLVNLKPLLEMLLGLAVSILGLVIVGMSYGRRWRRQMLSRISDMERTLGELKKARKDD